MRQSLKYAGMSGWITARHACLLFLLLGCAHDPWKDLRSSSSQTERFYVFKTKDFNYDQDTFGVFCSDEYSTRQYLNDVVGGPYSPRDCDAALEGPRKSRRDEFESLMKKIPYRRYKKQILSRSISIGMPKEVVLLIEGEPSDINRTVTTGAVSEQLVYPDKYIYIKNGKVITIQD